MAAQSLGAPAPVVFSYAIHDVRVVIQNDEPWFVGSDVMAALEIDRTQIRRLDSDEKGVCSIHTLGGDQRVSVINESGLYTLILTSRKAEAKKFKRWVTHEVLPAIRRTGEYRHAPVPRQQTLSYAQREEIERLIANVAYWFHYQESARNALRDRLRAELGVSKISDLPASRFREATNLLGTLDRQSDQIGRKVLEIEEAVINRIFRDAKTEAGRLEGRAESLLTTF